MDPEVKERQEALTKKLKELVGPMVAEAVEERFAKQGETHSIESKALAEVLTAIEGKKKKEDEDRSVAAQIGWCVARALRHGGSAAGHAKKAYGDDSRAFKSLSTPVEKAMQSDDFDQGGALVGETIADEIIGSLQAKAKVRMLGATSLPNPTGSLTLRKFTSGPTAYYIGEGEPVEASTPGTGQVIARRRKLATLVPISNDLLREADPRTEAEIRREMTARMAAREDLQFIRGVGSQAAPQGMRYWSSNLLDAETHVPGNVTLANVTRDLGRMMQAHLDANLDPQRPGWLFEPRTYMYLFTVRDGNGNLVFQPEMARGTLFSFPFAVTSQIPRNLDDSASAGNDETEVYFADFASLVIAEDRVMEFDAQAGAAYVENGTVKSGFSQDETILRVISTHDFVSRHDEAIVVLRQVVWGEAA